MDQLVSLHVCSFTNHIWIHNYHCMCVLFHKPHMYQPMSLHVFSFHKPHMDPLESLHMCSFHKPDMDPLESLHVCSYTKSSTRVIACVFFSQTKHGSTSVNCMCVLSTNHTWIR